MQVLIVEFFLGVIARVEDELAELAVSELPALEDAEEYPRVKDSALDRCPPLRVPVGLSSGLKRRSLGADSVLHDGLGLFSGSDRKTHALVRAVFFVSHVVPAIRG